MCYSRTGLCFDRRQRGDLRPLLVDPVIDLERLRKLAREGDEDARRELCDWTLRHTPGPWTVRYPGSGVTNDNVRLAWVVRWAVQEFGGLVEPLE